MGCRRLPDGIEGYQAGRMERSSALVRGAIEELRAAGEQVSFRNAAERSGLSRSTLYRNRELRAMVEGARALSPAPPSLADLQRELLELREELEALRSRGRVAYGFSYAEVCLLPARRLASDGKPELTHTGQ